MKTYNICGHVSCLHRSFTTLHILVRINVNFHFRIRTWLYPGRCNSFGTWICWVFKFQWATLPSPTSSPFCQAENALDTYMGLSLRPNSIHTTWLNLNFILPFWSHKISPRLFLLLTESLTPSKFHPCDSPH